MHRVALGDNVPGVGFGAGCRRYVVDLSPTHSSRCRVAGTAVRAGGHRGPLRTHRSLQLDRSWVLDFQRYVRDGRLRFVRALLVTDPWHASRCTGIPLLCVRSSPICRCSVGEHPHSSIRRAWPPNQRGAQLHPKLSVPVPDVREVKWPGSVVELRASLARPPGPEVVGRIINDHVVPVDPVAALRCGGANCVVRLLSGDVATRPVTHAPPIPPNRNPTTTSD